MMKKWMWMFVMPYALVQSSTVPTYNTLYQDGKEFFSCRGLDSLRVTCNSLSELAFTMSRTSYDCGRLDEAVSEEHAAHEQPKPCVIETPCPNIQVDYPVRIVQ